MSYSPFLSIAAAAFWLTACTSTSRPLATVPAVDLDRYYGRLYEIARLPNRFQAMCVSETQATYRPDGNTVAVLNQCQTATGLEQAKGIAKVVAGSRGARLKVSFFRPFYGDYRILDLDPDYRWVLVGEPGRQYASNLAREPKLDEATQAALLARAAELGFDRQAFIMTPHTRALR